MSRRKRCIECDELTDSNLIEKDRSNKNVCHECIYTEYFFCYNCNSITHLKDMALSDEDDDVLCINCRLNGDFILENDNRRYA